MSTTVAAFHNLSELEAAVGRGPFESDPVMVTQAMIDTFADVTLDPQWIHVDRERAARESPFGTTVAHGFLTLGLVTHFMDTAVAFPGAKLVVNYGLDKVRFPSPVPAGTELRAAFTLAEVAPASLGHQLTWHVEIRATGASKPAAVVVWLVRVAFA